MPRSGPNPAKRSMTAYEFNRRTKFNRYAAVGATNLEEYARAMGATIHMKKRKRKHGTTKT